MTGPLGEVAWRKSGHSGDGGCVEVADIGDVVGMRDTKDAGLGPVLTFDRYRWAEFVAGVRAGEFDVSRRAAED